MPGTGPAPLGSEVTVCRRDGRAEEGSLGKLMSTLQCRDTILRSSAGLTGFFVL